jgi:hypothetical protein
MKTHAFYCCLLMAFYVLAGCKSSSDPTTDKGSGSLKLTQNGTVVTEFDNTLVSAIGGNAYIVTISSPDTKHNVVLSIEGKSTGKYPFITPTETLTAGKANFLYQSYDLPEVYAGTAGTLIPNAGELEVTTAAATRCAGKFKGTGKNMQDGKTYTLEGTFDSAVIE